MKGLYWNRNGFLLIYKRLERKKFKTPKHFGSDRLLISHEQLAWLLDDFEFSELNYQYFY